MVNRRLGRLEETVNVGTGCPECGYKKGVPVEIIIHDPNGIDPCPTCEGPCQYEWPPDCSTCGQPSWFTFTFDTPNGPYEGSTFEDLEG